jgi:hypothetical protein
LSVSSLTAPSARLFPPFTIFPPPILIIGTSFVSLGINVIHSPAGMF